MKMLHASLLAALLSATMLIAAPAAGALAKTEPKADLALQRITIGRHYVVVKPSGQPAAPISVTVSIRNIGHAPAPASVTLVKLLQGTKTVARDEIPLRRLAPGHASTQIAIFHEGEPQLGFLRAAAKADRENQVSGSLENDFRATPEIPVIAQRWLARGMEVEQKTPGFGFSGDQDDITDTSFVIFTFSRVDASPARFAYKASGEVDTSTSISGRCNGQGDDKSSMSPWGQDSGLFIAKTLTMYEATVRASLASPFQIGVTCEGIPATEPLTVRFHDLLTTIASHGAPLPMNPTDARLTGHASSGAISSLTYTWTIVADLP
jgi:hypothetical protein